MSITKFQGPTRWLSNFATSVVLYDGAFYPTAEHAFQATKAASLEQKTWVREASSAAEAKKRGGEVTLRPDWEEIKLGVMHSIVWSKFSMNSDLKNKLFATGDQHLEEGNTWGDTFWGTCNGVGENHLGKITMRVRNELKTKLG